MEDKRLFEDIKAADHVGRSLERREPERPRVKAAERGRRIKPDGTTEDYERVEFL